MGTGDQSSMVERHQARADQVLVMARRHAEEIRAAAEGEAERVLLEVEREAARRLEEGARQVEELQIAAKQEAQRLLLEAEREGARRRDERLEADRRERARLAINKHHIEEALDATVAAVARIRELITALPSVESQQPMDIVDASFVPPASVPSNGEVGSRRNRVMNVIAIALGFWAVLMVATLMVLPRRAVNAEPTAAVATPAQVAHAAAGSAVASPQVTPAAARTAASTPDAETIRSSDDQALVVVFVAARDCWISIATDDGAWDERLLRASERYVARGRDVVSFKAGNAGALSVLINDQPTTPLGDEGRVVTRRITRANYRSFLAS